MSMRIFVVSATLTNNAEGEDMKANVLDKHREIVLASGRDYLFGEDLVTHIFADLGDKISFYSVLLV